MSMAVTIAWLQVASLVKRVTHSLAHNETVWNVLGVLHQGAIAKLVVKS